MTALTIFCDYPNRINQLFDSVLITSVDGSYRKFGQLLTSNFYLNLYYSVFIFCKPGGLDVETNRDRDRERP
jgi:hypothetical protein